ncbi:MAG: hypothetical protein HYU59_05660 [Magnetospirillum gryphiswaldense]|nr:hypothetical protein [Magnetospirillum gryphiswaldense]
MSAIRPVHLTRGKVALISEDDWPLVADWRWYAQYNPHAGKWYAATTMRGKKCYMHRLITACPPGLVVDHADGDGLFNIRENLRVTTHAFNAANCCSFGSIEYRGVTREGRRFRARINDKRLGNFDTPEEAAHAYDRAALDLWGPFAWLNFPDLRPDAARSHALPDPDVPF